MYRRPFILRRRKLGRTSTPAISAVSTTGIISRRDAHNIPEDCDLLIRWGCTSNVPTRNVLNTAEAIHTVNNKLEFRRTLNAEGLCPPTYFEDTPINSLPYNNGIVVRPSTHSRGRHLEVVRSSDELLAITRRQPYSNGWYASDLIAKVAEYRVFVVQGRAVAVAQKTPDNPNAVAWNVARGGRFDNVSWDNWPLKAVKVSIQAFNLSGLHFGGVDVMVDAVGNAYVIEINSAPSLTSEYRQECMAKAFDWIVTNENKDTIPLVEERGGYRKFIHPAISSNARLVNE